MTNLPALLNKKFARFSPSDTSAQCPHLKGKFILWHVAFIFEMAHFTQWVYVTIQVTDNEK